MNTTEMTSRPSIDIPLGDGEHISISNTSINFKELWIWETDEDIEMRFLAWARRNSRRCVYLIEESSDRIITVQASVPNDCEGQMIPSFSFECPSKHDSSFRTKEKQEPVCMHRTIFDIIFQAAEEIRTVEIPEINDDETAEILYEMLVNNSNVTRIEFSNSCISSPSKKVKPCARRPMELCFRLLASSSSLKEVEVGNVGNLPSDIVKLLFQSMQANSSLEVLDLWRGARHNPIDIEPLVSAILNSDGLCSLETLNLGGNELESTVPICLLAKELPSLRLKRLSLRGCSLAEDALIDIAKGLEGNLSLQKLDLSRNVITRATMDQLTLSLRRNKFLKTLTIEHCGINLDLAKAMAAQLPKIEHLQHLHMDGNEFTWKPLTKKGESLGAKMLLYALEENASITILQMGECGKIRLVSMVCCAPMPYSIILESNNMKRLEELLSRNKLDYEEYLRTRAKEAIVRIAKLLLSKMVADSDQL